MNKILLYTYKINVFLLIVMVSVLAAVMNPANAKILQSDTIQIDTVMNNSDSLEIVAHDSLNIDTELPEDTVMNHSDSLEIVAHDSLNIDTELPEDTLIIRKGKTKKEKTKPDTLVTYFFKDTLRYNRIITWTINRYLNVPNIVSADTLQSENMTELPFYREDVGVSYLGTTGGASLLHDFFKRKQPEIFLFMQPYSLYGFTPDNIRFYNTKGPFSSLSYYTSGNKRIAEDNIKVLFTRNINPSLNVGLYYHKMGTKGTYQNQRTKDKTFNMFVSYVGAKYVAHAGYIYNGVNNKENGGIVNDFFVKDTVINSDAIDVKLKSALNVLSSNTYFLTHSYGIPLNLFKRDSLNAIEGTVVYFGHSFEYSRYRRVYTDGVADTAYMDLSNKQRNYLHYYNNRYLSAVKSYDSTFASTFNNRLFIRLQPYSSTAIISKIDGGIGYQFDRYYGFVPESYLYGAKDERLSTGYIYGNAEGMFNKYFSWEAFLKYNFLGYRINDLNFDANARLSLYPLNGGIHFTGRFLLDNKEQPYFMKKYYSNHFQWNTNFNKTTETRIEAAVNIPDWNLEFGLKNSVISNYVYFNDNALPQQTSEILNITSLYLNSNLSWWLLRLDARLVVQNTSNDNILPLPALSGNVIFYLESQLVKNVLNARIGFDTYYNTRFYDYAYNPAVGMFHTQSERKLGNYPWVDLFASFKWKRANIYVKFTNAGEGILGERDYFSALHYPRNKRMFRYGINWYFHN
ncbi:MAG: putative porin [Prevotellaceae bacterium]|nr:putative porin [Prevotellaceae bacterium]